MDFHKIKKLESLFHDEIVIKYNLFRSLLLSLPYQELERAGSLLYFFTSSISKGFDRGDCAEKIVDDFFQQHVDNDREDEYQNLLFKFIQFIERQVALFDAIEDAAFSNFVRNVDSGTVKNLLETVAKKQLSQHLSKISNDYRLRIVLTAHPTQFYPRTVLGIMEDLRIAISNNKITRVNSLLMQLGKTPFRVQKKPTPLDEADSIIITLEETLFSVIPELELELHKQLNVDSEIQPMIELGFWPGGDRDGNPHVTSQTTEEVATRLKRSVIGCYLGELRLLLRHFTFRGIYEDLKHVQRKLKFCLNFSDKGYDNAEGLLQDLQSIEKKLVNEHGGMFHETFRSFIFKVRSFGFYFASLDLRQDSRVHHKATVKTLNWLAKHLNQEKRGVADAKALQAAIGEYEQADDDRKINTLENAMRFIDEIAVESKLPLQGGLDSTGDAMCDEVLKTIIAAQRIQLKNGEKSLHRYIISNTTTAVNIVELALLFSASGKSIGNLPFDLVPLFETIDDLTASVGILEKIFNLTWYRQHLQHRNQTQVVMLGYSDGTKDGGYVASNWTIFQAKSRISALAKRYGVAVVFFDGRGGPPSRGGGNTRNFYKALPGEIDNRQIQITIQGQTISSNFSTKRKAKYNIAQIFTAGLENRLGIGGAQQLKDEHVKLFELMVDVSRKQYLSLKADPMFLKYLQEISPLRFYGQSNIASRPTKRSVEGELKLEDLRAIPFVSSWSQIKQIVPAFYGFGSALQAASETYPQIDLRSFYKESLFFRAMVENSMQSLLKTDFRLTEGIKDVSHFAGIRNLIVAEETLTRRWLWYIAGGDSDSTEKDKSSQKFKGMLSPFEKNSPNVGHFYTDNYLQDDPAGRLSIKFRQRIIEPLLVIQQYALAKLRIESISDKKRTTYEKIVIRSMIGAVNASRNSA